MRFTHKSTWLDIDAEVNWPDGPPWEAENVNEFATKYRFEKDALWMEIGSFMEKWNVSKIYRLGKPYCGKVYYDAIGKRWLEGAELDAFLQQTSGVVSS